MGRNRIILNYGFVILASVMLFSQFLTPVEGVNDDARKDAEKVSAQSKTQKDALKKTASDAKTAWKTAKTATETAKDTYKNNKTTENKDAVTAAKAAEKTAYDAYKAALKAVKKFKNISIDN